MKKSLHISIILILLGFLILYYYNLPPSKNQKAVLFTIPKGQTLSYIANKLEEKQLIRNQTYFKILAKLTGKDKNIKAGVYEIFPDMTAYEILDLLHSGKIKMIQFTIIEGWTNDQIADYFKEQGFISDKEEFLNLTKDPVILKKYNIAGPTTEGFLFPETYTIDPQLKIEQIHEIMIKMFFNKLSNIVSDYKQIDPKELYQKVIIASIIEREAIHKEELPIMASVYYNRLKKKMKLQADPTIQYILKDPKKKLTLKDLEIESPV
ncbi:MAG: hypothetical protein KatS3mg129_0117 [Leptospiraceae bacterium]|nr:MAG: hypothetical protein KatS3mg129_0117 [Leptospiraceae bacterium]